MDHSVLGWLVFAAPDSETAGTLAFAECVFFGSSKRKKGGRWGSPPTKQIDFQSRRFFLAGVVVRNLMVSA